MVRKSAWEILDFQRFVADVLAKVPGCSDPIAAFGSSYKNLCITPDYLWPKFPRGSLRRGVSDESHRPAYTESSSVEAARPAQSCVGSGYQWEKVTQ